MKIDFHCHVFPPFVISNPEKYFRRDKGFSTLYLGTGSKMVTAEQLIESMDTAEIERAVILNVGWADLELSIETNDYLLEKANQYPDRLTAFCGINPVGGDGYLAEMERCAKAGAKGIGELHPDLQGFDLANVEMMGPFMEMAKNFGLTVLTHSSEPVGHYYPGKGLTNPGKLYTFGKAFPDVPIVMAHWGGGLPFYWLMPEVRDELQNVYFDCAASPFLYRSSVFSVVVGLVGADRVLFGSDYPLLSQKRVVREVEQTSLSGKEKGRVFWGNAMELLGT